VTALLGSRWVRIAVAAGLLIYFLWLSHPREVWRVVSDARWGPIVLAVVLTLADRALMAWRWLVLLGPLAEGTRPSFGRIMRIFFVSTFIGTFLPASVGGDVVRAYSLAQERVPLSAAAASVLVDRALGVVSILALGAASLALLRAPVPRGLPLIVMTGACGAVILAVVLFSDRAAALATGLLSRVPGRPIRRMAAALLEAVRDYRHHHAALISVLLGSIGVQVLRVLQAWCLGVGLGITAPAVVYFVSVPVILLIMLLPVTVSGLGTSQAAFLWCFGAAGVPAAEAFALSILFVALGTIGNLPGGLLYATSRTASQRA
jgi:uncharacterized protein (TIRG00374 family)